jgi:hypothetical protein
METKCSNCGIDFKPLKRWQKYCCNACRVSAHKKGAHAIETQQINAIETQQINAMETQNNNATETQSAKQVDAMLERILNERQQVFESKIATMQKDYENKILELRLTDLERKVKDLEKLQEDSASGIKMQDVMAGVGSYFATQMTSKMESNTKADGKQG